MRTNGRYERTLRVVMWLDAFLSVAMVAVCFFAAPVMAIVGVPRALMTALGVTSMVCAVLLAAFGAITAVALMLRMRSGNYLLPNGLRAPLPAGMRPAGVLPGLVR